jgi:signal transduction histidine kinase
MTSCAQNGFEERQDVVGSATSSVDIGKVSADGKRRQTDEKLRIERGIVDDAILEEQTDIDEISDVIISRSRTRADGVIAAARSTADRQTVTLTPSETIKTERVLEDKVLRKKRADADETIHEGREVNTAQLSRDRAETDRSLSDERSRSDDDLGMRDEFLGIVSHDLRNMLTGIVGLALLIERRIAEQNHVEQILGFTRQIRRSGARMERLIGDLVDISSIEAGKLTLKCEVGDPTPVVKEALETFQEKATTAKITLVAEIAPQPSLASFDPARILQVLTNLLGNAIKFTPANGKVLVRVARAGDEIRFDVVDTGIGIPDEKLKTVFERFIQVVKEDRRGLGLGLYISKSIVQGHGGRIWAESKLGEGSTFSFTLPLTVSGMNIESPAAR